MPSIVEGSTRSGVPSQTDPDEPTQPIELERERIPTLVGLELMANGSSETPVEVAGRYVIERCLGRGGMAAVYAAYDRTLARRVALKVLSQPLGSKPDVLVGFLREARYLARFRHPNIVDVLDFDSTTTGVVYLAMELLEGEDLRSLLERRGPLPWKLVLPIMLDICTGLEAAHEHGIVHRDLKPANCICVRSGDAEIIRIVDFGIATDAGTQGSGAESVLLGTPNYMAPEQVRGQAIDHRADIYAAGVILGELLTGRVPFASATLADTLAAHLDRPPPSLAALAARGVHIPEGLEAIYARALAKHPGDRYASIREFADALCRIERAHDQTFDVHASWLRRAALLLFGLGTLAGVVLTSLCAPTQAPARSSMALRELASRELSELDELRAAISRARHR